MKFSYDINTVLCPIIFNSNTIELTLHASCYLGLRLTLCYVATSEGRGPTRGICSEINEKSAVAGEVFRQQKGLVTKQVDNPHLVCLWVANQQKKLKHKILQCK